MNRIDTRGLLAGLALSALLSGAAFGAEPASTSEARPEARDSDARQPNCVRDTGTRIKSKQRKCQPLPGRSYTAEDLERNGALNAGDALRRIDPSVGGSVR